MNEIKKKIKSAIKKAWHRLRPYSPESYWSERLSKYGDKKLTCGRSDLDERGNEALYEQAERVMDKIFSDFALSADAEYAEIGPGNGIWTRWLRGKGVRHYAGYDITCSYFDELKRRFPDYSFIKKNICREALVGSYDVILMIDVTQHLMHEKDFEFSMKNIRQALRPGGRFIVTSWLKPYHKMSYNEVARPMERYQNLFAGCDFSEAIPFRDKFIFLITAPRVKEKPPEKGAG